MKVPEASIAKVVADAGQSMSNANYISGQVDKLMSYQPSVSQYVLAHQGELSVESLVTVLFYVSLIYRSISLAIGRSPSRVSYPDLDHAVKNTPDLETFAKSEPDVAAFIVSNLELNGEAENKVAGKVLAHVAAAMIDA